MNTTPRSKALPYIVSWRWRSDDPDAALKHDAVMATNATRAISRLIQDLSEEYADVRKNIVIMSVTWS